MQFNKKTQGKNESERKKLNSFQLLWRKHLELEKNKRQAFFPLFPQNLKF